VHDDPSISAREALYQYTARLLNQIAGNRGEFYDCDSHVLAQGLHRDDAGQLPVAATQRAVHGERDNRRVQLRAVCAA
jgi:hypothetical protein